MKTTLALIAAATLTLGLTACSGDPEPAKTVTKTQDSTPADVETADEPAPTSSGPTEGQDGVLHYEEGNQAIVEFGSTWTWPSGLSITVDEDSAYKDGVQFKATMKNGTDGAYDTSTPGVTVECNAEDVDGFYDGEAPERPGVNLLPGKSKTWTEAWDGSGECFYIIQPDFDEESVMFVSGDLEPADH